MATMNVSILPDPAGRPMTDDERRWHDIYQRRRELGGSRVHAARLATRAVFDEDPTPAESLSEVDR